MKFAVALCVLAFVSISSATFIRRHRPIRYGVDSGSSGSANAGWNGANTNVNLGRGSGPSSVGSKATSDMNNSGFSNGYQNGLESQRGSGSNFNNANQYGYPGFGSSFQNSGSNFNNDALRTSGSGSNSGFHNNARFTAESSGQRGW